MLEIQAKMVYVDCDGVLADFDDILEKHLSEFKNDHTKVLQLFYNNYEEMFLTSNRIEKGFDILNSLSDYRVLTSMPNFKDFIDANITSMYDAYERYTKLVNNKFNWLIKNGIKRENIIIVLNRKFKCHYSSPNSVLIDDYPGNILEWEQKGGIGILFNQQSDINVVTRDVE